MKKEEPKVFHIFKVVQKSQNQVMHKFIHIIHMEESVEKGIYIKKSETNVLEKMINFRFWKKESGKILTFLFSEKRGSVYKN
ncbi:MAG: hypothetical protein LUF78_04540 [Clostridiales bacterium]|nr:hypothetical protein [Clostridiales bacterium]